MSEGKQGFGFLALFIALSVGVAIGGSVQDTETKIVHETKWKDPGNQVTKYTINSVEATPLTLDEQGRVTNLTEFNGFELKDATERFRGGSVLVKNGLEQPRFSLYGEEVQVGSIRYTGQVYQSGEVIEQYTASCTLYAELEDETDLTGFKSHVYEKCFDLEVGE